MARAHGPGSKGPIGPKGPSAHGPGPIGPKGPPGIPRGDPPGIPRDPPGIPRDPLKSLLFKNRFFKKISVMLHTIIPSLIMIFQEFFYGIALPSTPTLMYRSGATFIKIDYFSGKTLIF